MNKKEIGLTFIMMGIIFLMLSFVLSTATLAWGVTLGVSIISNIVGTGVIMQFLKKEKTNVSS